MQTNFCAVKVRPAEDTECSGIICNADELTMGVCRTCLRGKALLAAAKPAMEQTRLIPQPLLDEQSTDEAKLDELKADEAPATLPTPPTAWAKIQRATGCATYGQLAAITGHSVSALRQQVMRLQYGKLPRRDNDVIPAIMRAGKFTLQDLIPGAQHIDFLPSSRPVCDPATSSPPTPSGSDTSAEPGGTIGSTDAQAAYDAAGAAIGVDLPAPFEQGLYAEGTAMDLGTTLPAPEDCECNEGHGPCGACYSCPRTCTCSSTASPCSALICRPSASICCTWRSRPQSAPRSRCQPRPSRRTSCPTRASPCGQTSRCCVLTPKETQSASALAPCGLLGWRAWSHGTWWTTWPPTSKTATTACTRTLWTS